MNKPVIFVRQSSGETIMKLVAKEFPYSLRQDTNKLLRELNEQYRGLPLTRSIQRTIEYQVCRYIKDNKDPGYLKKTTNGWELVVEAFPMDMVPDLADIAELMNNTFKDQEDNETTHQYMLSFIKEWIQVRTHSDQLKGILTELGQILEERFNSQIKPAMRKEAVQIIQDYIHRKGELSGVQSNLGRNAEKSHRSPNGKGKTNREAGQPKSPGRRTTQTM